MVITRDFIGYRDVMVYNLLGRNELNWGSSNNLVAFCYWNFIRYTGDVSWDMCYLGLQFYC